MMVNDSYGLQGRPLLGEARWPGPGTGGNNNIASSKNANRQRHATGPYGTNELYPRTYELGDGYDQFRPPEARPPVAPPRGCRQPQFILEDVVAPAQRREPEGYGSTPRPVRPAGTQQALRETGDRYRNEGPFVFGVHSPSQFQLGERFRADDTYDYADVIDEKSVIDNNESENLYCDKKINIKPMARAEERSSKRSMFRIADTRAGSKSAKEGRSKRDRDGPAARARARIKCVLLGDGAVGKTSLIKSYAQNIFLQDYRPTTFDNYNVVVEVDGRPMSVELCDTAGQDSPKGLRELCYPGTDVIMLCFSVVRPDTFRSVVGRWAPGVEAINAPLVLIGTQSDLRDCQVTTNGLKSQYESPVSESEARVLAAKLNAPYIETSSKTRSRLKDAFDSAILAALPVIKKKRPLWKRLFCIS